MFSLWLPSDDLLSRWGFNDGDLPEGVSNYAEFVGYSFVSAWKDVLCVLVRQHLIPVLEQRVSMVDAQTAHNPARAAFIDGVHVDDYFGDLSPSGVMVWWGEIVAADAAVAAMGSVPARRSDLCTTGCSYKMGKGWEPCGGLCQQLRDEYQAERDRRELIAGFVDRLEFALNPGAPVMEVRLSRIFAVELQSFLRSLLPNEPD